ncbi:winged helix-turn-helix domain-containing protein [uncultured Nostoc sp.]|uniref:winged helix-turn-helix domain-containing protein n=1 Tax=uncultured Nostoc sp. TaxID=340711 RepID=UPI0035C99AB0
MDQRPIQYRLLSLYCLQDLKRLGFSWKKARKLLNKTNPKKRAEFQGNTQRVIRQSSSANEKKLRVST